MSLYAFDAVEDAIAATRSFLFPFDLGRWLKLAFIMFFIGGGGGGSTPTQFGNTGSGSVPDPTGGGGGGMPTLPSIGPTEWAIIGAVVATIILIVLAFALVGAVFEFAFVESLRQDRVAIREFWGEYRNRGIRLFAFRLVTGLVVLAVVLGGLGLALWPLLVGSGEFSVALLLLLIPVIIVLALLNGLLQGFTTQFVVPVMLLENRGVIAGWKRFWPTLTGEWKEYLGYVVMRFVLQIALGILLGIVLLIAGIVVAIPLGILGVAGFALVQSQPVLGWGIVAIAGLLFGLSVLLLSLFGAVPVQTFLRYYALLVLGETNEAFDAIPSQRAAAQE
jgi:hypothetical protein